jgi:hypothetical protein
MNSKEAKNFSEDIAKELNDFSYIDSVYISVKGVGTKVFKRCKCDQIDGWLFVWTPTESFYTLETDLGDFIIIDANFPIMELK